MVKSKTKEEWDTAYSGTKLVLRRDPKLISIFNAVFINPTYYAGYYLRQFEGNLGKRGDTHAE
jgi:hypothetical protein